MSLVEISDIFKETISLIPSPQHNASLMIQSILESSETALRREAI